MKRATVHENISVATNAAQDNDWLVGLGFLAVDGVSSISKFTLVDGMQSLTVQRLKSNHSAQSHPRYNALKRAPQT